MKILRHIAASMLPLFAGACSGDVQPTAVERSRSEQDAAPQSSAAATAPAESETASMSRAIQTGKLSAPVDVYFQFSDDVAAGRPVRVDFAVSPQVVGDNLRFELVESDAAIVESADRKLDVQKANASGVYRKSVTLTPRAGLTKLQVIVSMSIGADTFAGVYSIPVGSSAAKGSKETVESLNRRTE